MAQPLHNLHPRLPIDLALLPVAASVGLNPIRKYSCASRSVQGSCWLWMVMEGRLENCICVVALLDAVDVFDEREETEDMDDERGVVYMSMICGV
jgi:hypothetical protein